MEYWYIEASIKESCDCSNMLEVFLVMSNTKEEAIKKVKAKLTRSKEVLISRIYRCSDIKDGVYLIYAERM